MHVCITAHLPCTPASWCLISGVKVSAAGPECAGPAWKVLDLWGEVSGLCISMPKGKPGMQPSAHVLLRMHAEPAVQD